MSKTLHLNLHRKWFDMIASGEKQEEYRACSEYWKNRFKDFYDEDFKFKYDTITFSNGYTKDRRQMVVELTAFGCGVANAKFKPVDEWGAPYGEMVYIMELGEIISKNWTDGA